MAPHRERQRINERAYRARKRAGTRSMAWNRLTWHERFERLVDQSGASSGCWTWLGFKKDDGYGIVRRGKGRSTTAHRDVYRHLVGPIPDDMTLDHLCRNTSCVNPAHMEVVTIQENIRRARAVVTHCKNGHDYATQNISSPGEVRACRACRKASKDRWLAKKSAA